MATVTTSFFGSYDVTVNIAVPTTTIDVSTRAGDSLEDLTDQENRQEFRVLPREVIKFIEEKIDAAQKNAGVLEIQMDVDLTLFERWDYQLDTIFLNHRKQERWILSRNVVSQVRELRLTRRTTPITLTFPLAD
jgi:hypothetical protein